MKAYRFNVQAEELGLRGGTGSVVAYVCAQVVRRHVQSSPFLAGA